MLGIAFTTSLVGALLGITGGLVLIWKEQLTKKFSVHLVAFAAGSLLATAFMNLIPEAAEGSSLQITMVFALLGFLSLFVLEKLLLVYHCHDGSCDVHDPNSDHTDNTFVYTILIGDTLHNFVDGIAIALAFLINMNLGFATAIAVFAHEFPQEVGDMGVLLHGQLTKMKALGFNVVSALATPIGTLAGFYAQDWIQPYQPGVIAFIAGTFVYVASSDLVPHLKEEWEIKKSAEHIFLLFLGVFVIWFVLGLHHTH